MGLHKNIAHLHGDMLEHAVYRIKTQLGLSTGTYSHSHRSLGRVKAAAPPPVLALELQRVFQYIREQMLRSKIREHEW